MSTIKTADGGNISSDRYVEITSGVGGAAAVNTRQLILRLFTTNERFPTNSVVSFSSADDVLNYLSQDSTQEEYKQAAYYFGYISKSITKPKSMSIARWADADTSAQVFGAEVANLDTLKAYTSGTLTATLDGASYSATGIDFSTATSYADVADDLETIIQAMDASLASTTVTYNSTTKGFDVDTNGTADGALTFASSTSGFLTDIGLDSLAIFSSGIAAQTLTSLLSSSSSLSNNFLSIAFVDELDATQEEEIATWVDGQNFKYAYCHRSTKSNASANNAALSGYGGVIPTLYDSSITDEYPWLHPAAALGAINPAKPNSFPNFMYDPDSALTALITTDSEADTYDALGYNYMGRTQEAGSEVTWYQRGVMWGGSTDARTISVYAGEAWLKSDLKASFINMFNALPSVTPNTQGASIIKSYLQASIDSALNNGVILVGKTLTTTQKAYITQVTGSDDAYQAVANDGYWFDISFESSVAESGAEEWSAIYTLVYAKADKIRKVEGTHILI